jgi:polysaccharide biosynthesis transport protein
MLRNEKQRSSLNWDSPLKKYIDPLLRWWWLILLCTLLAAGASYYTVQQMPPEYRARATLVVGKTYNNPNPTSGDLYLEQQLASVYSNMANQGQLNAPTLDALGLSRLPGYFVRPISNTPLIEILVTDTDPVRVQAVTNELADQMVKSSPTGVGTESSQRQEFIVSQLEKLQLEIIDTEQKITEANEQLAEASSARQISDIQTLISALSQKRISLQENYTSFLRNTNEGSTNNIRVLQYASLPRTPVGPNKMLYLALASALGLFLAVGAAYLIEIIDSRVKSESEFSELLDSTIIGHIPSIPTENRGFYTDCYPRSPITDTFRTLRTNIEFMAVNHPVKILLVTGTEPSIGKTTVASNLAFAFAQANKRVILIDGDLRQPQLHNVLQIENGLGVTDACLGRVSIEKTLIPWERKIGIDEVGSDEPWSKDQNLFRFMPAGSLPPNPTELLASSRFEQVLDELYRISDLVIIDSPPIFVPDTSILLSKVDGVLLVFQAKRTQRKSLQLAREQLVLSRAHVLGMVMNQSDIKTDYYTYNYKPKKTNLFTRWKTN